MMVTQALKWGKDDPRMNKLPDDLLLEAYYSAVEQRLDPAFIRMLAVELSRRKLKPASVRMGA